MAGPISGVDVTLGIARVPQLVGIFRVFGPDFVLRTVVWG